MAPDAEAIGAQAGCTRIVFRADARMPYQGRPAKSGKRCVDALTDNRRPTACLLGQSPPSPL